MSQTAPSFDFYETEPALPSSTAKLPLKDIVQSKLVKQWGITYRDVTESAPGSMHYRLSEIIELPRFRPLQADAQQVFAATKEWEGSVQEISEKVFVAELREMIQGEARAASDIAEIPIEDIPAADRHLLREGAIFRYLVGYAKTQKGTITRKRHVYFRRGKAKTNGAIEKRWLMIASKFRD